VLVLSRKAADTLFINGPAKITICSITPNRITVGIEAPDTTEVIRGELLPQGYKVSEDHHVQLTRRVRQKKLTDAKLET
jgi:carbon storage regulator CsrA